MVVHPNRFRRWKTKIGLFVFLPLNNQSALSLSFLLTGLLAFVEFFFSQRTNSLLLFCTALAQLSLSIFILFLLFTQSRDQNTPNLAFRLAISLLNGFLLLLLTGYVFLEIHSRVILPAEVIARQALAVLLISLIGNLVIQRLLLTNDFLRKKFGSFHFPLPGMNVFFLFALLTIALIYLTNIDLLDTIFGLLMGLTLFTWAGFTMMDAYWKILEVRHQ